MVRKLEASPSLFSSERSRHNRKSKDFLVSFRYSEAGFPITGKGKNCKALTISDCRKRAFNLKKLDPRLFTAEEIEYARSLADEEYSEFFIPSQEEMGEFKFGSILFGVREKSIISIELLEMTWLQER